jgi:2-aminoadipate transaminase
MPWESLVSERSRPVPLPPARRRAPVAPPADTIDLASQQPSPDLMPIEALRRCIDHALKGRQPRSLGYSDDQGLPALRSAIADDLADHGLSVPPDDIVVTSGSQQAIDLLARVLVDPGDRFLVETSTYPGALRLFAAAGARLVAVSRDADGPALLDLRRHARKRPKGLYLMPNHHNPMGVGVSAERRAELVQWSHASGVPLIEDDYDAGLSLDGRPMPPRLRAMDADVLHLGTYSKKLIPALRIGYLVCPPSIRARVVSMKTAQDNGTSDLLQHALAEFLARGYLRAHAARVIRAYRVRRDALEAALKAHLPATITWEQPERGLFLWIPLPPGISADAVAEEGRRLGVRVLPSSLFAATGHESQALRVTYCRESSPRLAEGARRLAAAIRTISSRGRATAARRTRAVATLPQAGREGKPPRTTSARVR